MLLNALITVRNFTSQSIDNNNDANIKEPSPPPPEQQYYRIYYSSRVYNSYRFDL